MYVSQVKAREEWWKQSEAIPYIGIVASEQTRLLMGKDTLPKYFSHTLGAFRAVFEAHLPVRVLSEYDLENADLQGIKVLVLPDVRVLSDRSSEVVRRFVKAGGGLVASGGTGLYDHTLTRRANFSLADLFQADYVGLARSDHARGRRESLAGQRRSIRYSTMTSSGRGKDRLAQPQRPAAGARLAGTGVEPDFGAGAGGGPDAGADEHKREPGDRVSGHDRLDLWPGARGVSARRTWTRRCSFIPTLISARCW